MPRRTLLTPSSVPDHLLDFRLWPGVDEGALSTDSRRLYLLRKAGIETYCRTRSLEHAATAAATTKREIHRLFSRCLSTYADGRLAGWRALIPHLRLRPYVRKSTRPGSDDARSGFAGLFGLLMSTYPSLRARVHSEILHQPDAQKQRFQTKIPITALTQILVEECRRLGIPETEYPLNTQSAGRKALARYVKALVQTEPARGVLAQHGAAAANRLKLGTGAEPLWITTSTQPFDFISLDAHRVDCIGTVQVETPTGPLPIAVSRIWVVAVFEQFLRPAIGYAVSFEDEVSALTVERALKMSVSRWEPVCLPERVPPHTLDSGLPSALYPQLVNTFGAVLSVDNALAHLSQRIAEKARRRLGCSVVWAPSGGWYQNAELERFFGTLERFGFQVLSSTTGSGPSDVKRTSPVRNAIRDRITVDELQALTDVFIAHYNALKHDALGGRSPLDALKDYIESSDAPLFIRPLPSSTSHSPDLGVTIESGTIRGNIARGVRPYVQLAGERYTSPELANNFETIGREVRIHYADDEDFRHIQIFTLSGIPLGTLTVQGHWRRIKHTKRARDLMNKGKELGRAKNLRQVNPVDSFMRNLEKVVLSDVHEHPHHISEAATQLNRLRQEIGDKVRDFAGPTEPDEQRSSSAQSSVQNDSSRPTVRPLVDELRRIIPRPQWKTNERK